MVCSLDLVSIDLMTTTRWDQFCVCNLPIFSSSGRRSQREAILIKTSFSMINILFRQVELSKTYLSLLSAKWPQEQNA